MHKVSKTEFTSDRESNKSTSDRIESLVAWQDNACGQA